MTLSFSQIIALERQREEDNLNNIHKQITKIWTLKRRAVSASVKLNFWENLAQLFLLSPKNFMLYCKILEGDTIPEIRKCIKARKRARIERRHTGDERLLKKTKLRNVINTQERQEQQVRYSYLRGL